jgi:cystathionine beta-lyase/cystathionine gamma-synthase
VRRQNQIEKEFASARKKELKRDIKKLQKLILEQSDDKAQKKSIALLKAKHAELLELQPKKRERKIAEMVGQALQGLQGDDQEAGYDESKTGDEVVPANSSLEKKIEQLEDELKELHQGGSDSSLTASQMAAIEKSANEAVNYTGPIDQEALIDACREFSERLKCNIQKRYPNLNVEIYDNCVDKLLEHNFTQQQLIANVASTMTPEYCENEGSESVAVE